MVKPFKLVLRWLKISLLTLSLLFVAGCWSKEELNDRTFITTLLVDRTDAGETEVSALFILPNRLSAGLSPSPNEKPYTLVTRTGRNVAEAIQKLQEELSRSVNWGQMRVIVIGDKYARAGMAPLFDYLLRAPDFRLRVFVFYFDGLVKDLAKLDTIFERSPAEIWREAAHTQRVPPVTIRDLLYSQWNNLGDGFIPELDLHTVKLPTETKTVHWSGIGGAALMKDAKIVSKFTKDETKGILLLTNRIRELIVTANLPDNKGEPFSARLFGIKPYTRAVRQGDRVLIRVDIEAEGDLMSIHDGFDLEKPANIVKLEKALSLKLRELAESAVEQARRNKSDAFQWSEYVKYESPALWREWSDDLRDQLTMNISADIRVHVHLRSTGVNRSSKK
ncbi:Ger(x)C family spore germination protein [Cohnella yongneupensis]|uniref:Ger(X)C family spore germination protein n=1 Tax=Cohnella yongneupensis TaxID=425006 RepID=A0ABW0R1D6_9BACL